MHSTWPSVVRAAYHCYKNIKVTLLQVCCLEPALHENNDVKKCTAICFIRILEMGSSNEIIPGFALEKQLTKPSREDCMPESGYHQGIKYTKNELSKAVF